MVRRFYITTMIMSVKSIMVLQMYSYVYLLNAEGSDVSILKGCSHFTHVEGLMAGKETALLTTTGSGSWC